MSKLYNQYVFLKMNNPNKYFLFKSGIFYIFLDEDAKLMSKILDLKLGALNLDIVKCGFPEQSLDKYMHILNNYNYDVEIVNIQKSSVMNYKNYVDNSKLMNIINDFLNTDINSLSISESYDLLQKLQNNICKLKETIYTNENKNKKN